MNSIEKGEQRNCTKRRFYQQRKEEERKVVMCMDNKRKR